MANDSPGENETSEVPDKRVGFAPANTYRNPIESHGNPPRLSLKRTPAGFLLPREKLLHVVLDGMNGEHKISQ